MKLATFVLLLIASNVNGSELHLGFYPAVPKNGQITAQVIFEIESKADRTIHYDRERNFDLGLEKISGGIRHPIKLSFPEIKFFLERERHKGLIVVWFDKTVMWNEEDFIAKRATEIINRMKEIGYNRVVVLGAHSAGVHYVADTSHNNQQAEQNDAEKLQ